MDETPIPPHYRRDGFPSQRMGIVPRPQVDAMLAQPGTRRLSVTDAGFFPLAAGHLTERRDGIPETIVIVCVSGRGIVRLGDRTYELTGSSCVTIPAGARHAYAASRDEPWTIWWMHVAGADVGELTGPLLGASRPVLRLRSLDRVVALFDELVALVEGRLTGAHLLAASGVAWNLLTRIAADSILPADGSALERAIRYLEARTESRIQVPELAAIVGLSASHLTALFRQTTGNGPAAFHTSLRMARARTLLDTTSLSVTQIAEALGYQDPLYFSRQFRARHGVSPSAYRAQHKG